MIIKRSQHELAEEAILNFFDRNRDEELAVKDAIIKFDIAQSTATRTLNKLATDGLLNRRIERAGRYNFCNIYSRA
jgi:Fic family protein